MTVFGHTATEKIEDVRNFLRTLSPDAMAARFDSDYVPEQYFVESGETVITASRDGKIAGFMDHVKSDMHLGDTAQVNIVVSDAFHGKGVARELGLKQDAILLEQGYQYKYGYVHLTNTAQLERLQKTGWKICSHGDPDDGMMPMWKALHPENVDREPALRLD